MINTYQFLNAANGEVDKLKEIVENHTPEAILQRCRFADDGHDCTTSGGKAFLWQVLRNGLVVKLFRDWASIKHLEYFDDTTLVDEICSQLSFGDHASSIPFGPISEINLWPYKAQLKCWSVMHQLPRLDDEKIMVVVDTVEAFLKLIERGIPELTSRLEELLFVNKSFFARMVNSYDAICRLVEMFPYKKDEFAQRLLANPLVLSKLSTNIMELVGLVGFFPNHSHALFDKFLDDDNEFDRVIQNYEALTWLTESILNRRCRAELREKADALLRRIIATDKLFHRIVSNIWIVRKLIEWYPNCAVQLEEKLLGSQDEFNRLVTSDETLLCFVSYYPKEVKRVISMLSNRGDVCARLVRSGHTLVNLHKNSPEMATQLMQLYFFDNQDALARILTDRSSLLALARIFPEHVNILFKSILNTQSGHNMVIPDSGELLSITECFPEWTGELVSRCIAYFEHLCAKNKAGLRNFREKGLFQFLAQHADAQLRPLLLNIFRDPSLFDAVLVDDAVLFEFKQLCGPAADDRRYESNEKKTAQGFVKTEVEALRGLSRLIRSFSSLCDARAAVKQYMLSERVAETIELGRKNRFFNNPLLNPDKEAYDVQARVATFLVGDDCFRTYSSH